MSIGVAYYIYLQCLSLTSVLHSAKYIYTLWREAFLIAEFASRLIRRDEIEDFISLIIIILLLYTQAWKWKIDACGYYYYYYILCRKGSAYLSIEPLTCFNFNCVGYTNVYIQKKMQQVATKLRIAREDNNIYIYVYIGKKDAPYAHSCARGKSRVSELLLSLLSRLCRDTTIPCVRLYIFIYVYLYVLYALIGNHTECLNFYFSILVRLYTRLLICIYIYL